MTAAEEGISAVQTLSITLEQLALFLVGVWDLQHAQLQVAPLVCFSRNSLAV